MRKPRKKRDQSVYAQKRREKLKSLGLCIGCGKKPPMQGKTTCLDCRKVHLEAMKVVRQKKRGAKAEELKDRGGFHNERHKEAFKKGFDAGFEAGMEQGRLMPRLEHGNGKRMTRDEAFDVFCQLGGKTEHEVINFG